MQQGRLSHPSSFIALFAFASACSSSTASPPPSAPGASKDDPSLDESISRTHTGSVNLSTAHGELTLVVLEEGLIQASFAKTGVGEKPESYARDPSYKPTSPAYELTRKNGTITLKTSQMSLIVTESPLTLTQTDNQGNVTLTQSVPELFTEQGAKLHFSLDDGEKVYGLGDKAKGLNRRGEKFEMWNTDAFGWKVDQDPLYKTFPIFLFSGATGSHKENAHGLFIDSPARAKIDVGSSASDKLTYDLARADHISLYFIAGTEPKQVVSTYTLLTGRPYLPPYWSVGFHQSRYGYKSEQELRQLVKRFRKDKLPLDVLWLDIDYQQDFAPFTVNQKEFPTFRKMVSDLKADGVNPVCITDLHIKSYQGESSPSGYAPFDSGVSGDHFIKDAQGKYFEGEVWPGKSVFPEFTRATTREWWGKLYAGFVEDGVSGFWNDMNEPALFNDDKTMPVSQLHRLDNGKTVTHEYLHNAYGALNVRATFEGVQKLRPGVRPFVLTRAAFAGAQRYSASWTGDNVANREHLKATISTLTNMGVSGYANIGADVGGFDGCPTKELLAEWMELGAFQPFYRNHSGKGTCLREPWVHGPQVEARIRRAIEARYVFLPYIYTVFEEASRTGYPVMRPLWFEHPKDESIAETDSLFFVGDNLLVAPKLQEGTGPFTAQLPKSAFYNMSTGALIEDGGPVTVQLPEDQSIQLFARAGAIIPQGPVIQHTGEKPKGPLTLAVFPGKDCHGTLYTDDGQSYDYKTGEYLRLDLSCQSTSTGVTVEAKSSGAHPAWWSEVEVVIYGTPNAPAQIKENTIGALSQSFDAKTKSVRTKFKNSGESFRLTALF